MIEIRACARLHLGLLDHSGAQGRLYGSIGLSVNRPHLLLRAEKADRLIVEGAETERVTEYARRFIQRHGGPSGARLNLSSGIPAHVGLGSGTQIALAVGTALARLSGLKISAEEIALTAGRGVRSGIGIATFQHGGFILDGGHPVRMDKAGVPPVLFRHSLPRDWYFVTAIPGKSQGFNGEREDRAFRHLPPVPSHLAEKISWLVLMKMLPALVEKNVSDFGRAMTEIQWMVGECFAPVQGGRFSNPLSEKLIEFMFEHGVAGAGQSSWGPAVYGLVEGREAARLLMKAVRAHPAGTEDSQVFCVRPQNRGAIIKEFRQSAPVSSEL